MAKNSSKKNDKSTEELSYEQALTELEQIVNDLEEGNISLEESMKLFERGQLLIRHCNDYLESAQLKVKKLTESGLTPFEEEVE